MSKYQTGDDGKTGYERLKGKKYDKELAESGEIVHYRYDKKVISQNKLEVRWGEGFFLGVRWRTGEMIIGNSEGIHKASTIKRVGAHRRWDGEELKKVRGWPWKCNPDEEDPEQGPRVKYLTESSSGRPWRFPRMRRGSTGCVYVRRSSSSMGLLRDALDVQPF